MSVFSGLQKDRYGYALKQRRPFVKTRMQVVAADFSSGKQVLDNQWLIQTCEQVVVNVKLRRHLSFHLGHRSEKLEKRRFSRNRTPAPLLAVTTLSKTPVSCTKFRIKESGVSAYKDLLMNIETTKLIWKAQRSRYDC